MDRRLAKYVAVLPILFPVHATSSAQTVPQRNTTLCKPQEAVVFSCHIHKKIVSICSSGADSEIGSYMQYRFGLPDGIEMRLPNVPSSPTSSFHGARIESNNGRDATGYLRINNGSYSYIVYQATSYDGDRPGGLVVEKDGKIISRQMCNESYNTKVLSYRFWRSTGITKGKYGFMLYPWDR